jgi:hypothetical protein
MDLPISLLAALSDDLIRTMCDELPRLADVQALCDRAARPGLAEDITEYRVWSGHWGVVGSYDNGDPCFVRPKDVEAPQGIVAAVHPMYRGSKPYRLFEEPCVCCGCRTDHYDAVCVTCNSDRQPYSAESAVDQTDWDQSDYQTYHEDLLKECGPLNWSEK